MLKQYESSVSSPFFSIFPSLHTLIITLLLNFMLLHNAIADTGAKVTVQNVGIKAIATVVNVTAMQLRVAGPDDFYDVIRSEGPQVNWYAPDVLKEGEYRYEVFVTVGYEDEENNDTPKLYRNHGRFVVKDNVITPWQAPVPTFKQPLSTISTPQQQNWLSQLFENILSFIVSPAQAETVDYLTIKNFGPLLWFNDMRTDGNDWYISGDDLGMVIRDKQTNNNIFSADKGTPFETTLGSHTYGVYNNDSYNYLIDLDKDSGVVLSTDTEGDIYLANFSVFIDKSANRIGIGTITPEKNLHIADPRPAIVLEDTDGDKKWTLNSNPSSNIFNINYSTSSESESPFSIRSDAPNNSLYLNSTGIGMGRMIPDAALHLWRDDGTAQLMVQEESSTTDKRQLMRLMNNGPIRFSIENTDTTITWDFLVNNNGFVITRVGTGGAEFIVNNDGSVQMGPGGVANFVLENNGNLTIAGILKQNSDRDSKENITLVQESDVLSRLMQLPIARWNYKDDKVTHRHLGPMAQDFYQAFGLGKDDKHMATLDMAGVALVSIQALQQQVTEKDRRIDQLQKQQQSNEKRIAALQEQLNQMQATLSALFNQPQAEVVSLR